MSTAPAKICQICNQDCSRKARVKDGQGRYSCEECVAQKKAEALLLAGADPAPGPERKPITKKPTSAAPRQPTAPVQDDEALPAGFWDEQGAAPAIGVPVASAVCAKCGAAMPGGAVVCLSCGFNSQSRSRVRTRVGAIQPAKEKRKQPSAETNPWLVLAIVCLIYAAMGIAAGMNAVMLAVSLILFFITALVAFVALVVGAFQQGHTGWGLLILAQVAVNLSMRFMEKPNLLLAIVSLCMSLAILVYTFVINKRASVKILYAATFVGFVTLIASAVFNNPEALSKIEGNGAPGGAPIRTEP